VEAAEITVTENLQRLDLHPLEEARAVGTLLLVHNGDHSAVAAKVGQTATWVACRARIHTHLSEPWKTALTEPKSPFWFWSAAHLEVLAKLAPEVQDEVLGCFDRGSFRVNLTVEDLRDLLSDLTMRLERAPFPLDDETLLPSAGACTTCPLNTLATPLLFADAGDQPADIAQARCLNRNCWREKCHLAAERRAAQLRSTHPDLLLVQTDYRAEDDETPPAWDGQILPPYAFTKVKKSAKGAQPALVAAGSGSGKLIWVVPSTARSQPSRPHEAPLPSPEDQPQDALEGRRQKLFNRRISRLAERTKALLGAEDARVPPAADLVALAAVFGTSHNSKLSAWGASSEPWEDFARQRELPLKESSAELWRNQLVPVLLTRLQYCGPQDAARLDREVRATLALVGADYADLFRQVAREIPEPKNWSTIPGYEPENLDSLSEPAPQLALAQALVEEPAPAA
jgi:hypothetical protein